MRTIIAGTKSFVTYQDLVDAITSAPFNITAIIAGTTRRIDEISEQYARERHLPLCRFSPDVETYGDKAIDVSNNDMVSVADALIVLWSGMSDDTKYITEAARDNGLLIHVWHVALIKLDIL